MISVGISPSSDTNVRHDLTRVSIKRLYRASGQQNDRGQEQVSNLHQDKDLQPTFGRAGHKTPSLVVVEKSGNCSVACRIFIRDERSSEEEPVSLSYEKTGTG
jgi:hypothetical protein